jgi:Uma2 family endonuclease
MVIKTSALEPLRDGERLSREEFHRRYEAMPELKKCELIRGVVYMPSPVTFRGHSKPHAAIFSWLTHYSFRTPGTELGDNGTVILGDEDEPQPDAVLFAPAIGRCRINDDDYLVGPPELVCEISKSSLARDTSPRFEMYREAGVLEYLIWRVEEGVFDWWRLRDDGYEALPAYEDGVFRSEVFPGLWLDPQAMIRFDDLAITQLLQTGMSTPEYTAFVQRLIQTNQE